jgi:hypothetical protein
MKNDRQAILWIVLVFLVLVLACTGVNLLRSNRPTSAQRGIGYTAPQSHLASFYPAAMEIKAQPGEGTMGGVPGGSARIAQIDKKIIHTAELAMVVDNVEEASAKIRALTLQANGEIDQARVWSLSEETREGELHIRIPAEGLGAVLKQIKTIGRRVTNEQLSATDVTRQFADNDARMRSLRAEEQQYLQILKQAKSVQDVLDITEKLTEVRTQIEQLQASINVMSHDIAMSVVAIGLSQNAPATSALATWHPLLNARRAFRNMVEGLGDWIDAMVSFAIFLPVIGLWLGTIGAAGWVAWKFFRRMRPIAKPTP